MLIEIGKQRDERIKAEKSLNKMIAEINAPFYNAKKGDTVYVYNGTGFYEHMIYDIQRNKVHPIKVNCGLDFDLWGRNEEDGKYMLFWEPFEIPKRPKRKINVNVSRYILLNKHSGNQIEIFPVKSVAEVYRAARHDADDLIIVELKGSYETEQ